MRQKLLALWADKVWVKVTYSIDYLVQDLT